MIPPSAAPDDEILHARDVLAQRWARGRRPRVAPPGGIILCHQGRGLGTAASWWRSRRVAGFDAEIRLLHGTHGRVAVATGFGVGAPAAVALLEELVAFGVRRFVSVGLAGGLRPDQQPGGLVVAERALRDEGTSAHYLPPGEAVDASAPLTRRLASALERAGRPYMKVAVCTTDAPYRTTRAAVERWTRAGGAAVEMEAAGLFAAASRRGVDVAAACCLADTLTLQGWRLDFDEREVASGLRRLFAAATEALQ